MSGTSGGYTPPQVYGESAGGVANLQAVASDTWVTTGAEVVLPEAGTYAVSADLYSDINGTTPWAVAVNARLFDVTAGAPVPGTDRRIQYDNVNDGGGSVLEFQNAGALNANVTVTGQTTIRLEGMRQHVGFNDSTLSALVGERLAFIKINN
ncbi:MULTISPECIES: hypothetical protein [unclassified Streptomyces]|uniref:hypothetical protein n=1 Tax=unclassified Streptomyces TaxID=2593676 RepID=UPI002DD8C3DC|nr:hypothetical protein [Streptomyces sp. NBC_01763]WSC35549.1 hypothetical protein OHA08_08580 [Streptomyces sp. NBC_01763]WSF88251.1 hypothetical protein OIE70_37120 [Streptomyces sp. NBC_01744]